MCLVEDTEDLVAFFPPRGVGGDDRAAHVGAGHDGGEGAAGRAMVIVESHADFSVAVVERDG